MLLLPGLQRPWLLMQLGDQLAPSSAAPGTSGSVCACLFLKKKRQKLYHSLKNEINEIHTITSEGIDFRFRVGRFLTKTPIHHLHHEKHPLKLQLHKAQKHLNNHHYRRTMQAWKVQKKNITAIYSILCIISITRITEFLSCNLQEEAKDNTSNM
jgi:hypothetical protein